MNLDNCNSLNDIARQEFGKANYTNREKIKKLLFAEGIDWQQWLAEKKKKEQRFCKNCGKDITEKEKGVKFCCQSCATTYNNHLKKKIRYCETCGKELNNRQKKYCSFDCQKKHESQEFIKRWKAGLEDGLSGEYQLSKHIRHYLLEKHNYKCELCGWGEKNQYIGTIPLEIHHKDGNYLNNKEENLQVLCPNCHSLTETHKSHNKDGRKGRKKYYKDEEE